MECSGCGNILRTSARRLAGLQLPCGVGWSRALFLSACRPPPWLSTSAPTGLLIASPRGLPGLGPICQPSGFQAGVALSPCAMWALYPRNVDINTSPCWGKILRAGFELALRRPTALGSARLLLSPCWPLRPRLRRVPRGTWSLQMRRLRPLCLTIQNSLLRPCSRD